MTKNYLEYIDKFIEDKKHIPQPRYRRVDTDNVTSLYSMQAKLIGMDVKQFQQAMHLLPELMMKTLAQGKKITIPTVLGITPVVRTFNLKVIGKATGSTDKESISRTYTSTRFYKRFKLNFTAYLQQNKTDLF